MKPEAKMNETFNERYKHEVKGKSFCKEEDIVDYNINKEQATTFLILKTNSRPNFNFRHDGFEKYF